MNRRLRVQLFKAALVPGAVFIYFGNHWDLGALATGACFLLFDAALS